MRAIIVVLIIVCLGACGGKNKVPKGILEREKMETVLWDMLQADEFLKDHILNKDSTLNDTTESIRMYERVFAFNNTSREEFSRSFKYYREHTSLIKDVLDSLNVKGTQPDQHQNTPRPIESVRIDTGSIRKRMVDTLTLRKIRRVAVDTNKVTN
jgi:hypothetical protein